jgi:hypothetical protein
MTTQFIDDDQEIASATAERCPVRLHRPSNIADWLDTSLSTVRRLARAGILEAVYVNASMRITDRSYRRVAKQGTQRSRPRGKK